MDENTTAMRGLNGFHAQQAAARQQAIRDITGRYTGTMEVGGVKVHIDREISFSRDQRGGWGICFFRTDPDAAALIARGTCDGVSASLQIEDPAVCAVFDRFAELLANPAGEEETIGAAEQAAAAAD